MTNDRADFSDHCCFKVWLSRGSRAHTHSNQHELLYCASGGGEQRTRERAYSMARGDFFVFPAGQEHYAVPHEGGHCHCTVLMLNEDRLAREVGSHSIALDVVRHLTHAAGRNENRVQLSRPNTVRQILERLLDEFAQQKPGFECAVRLQVEHLLLEILRDPAVYPHFRDRFKPGSVTNRMANVIRFIETQYMTEIKVDQLAKMACVSRSHFHATFKAATGVTLVQYINRIRIRAAQQRLNQGTAILDASLQCGFSNLSHFYHTFKRETGMTPRQWSLKQI